MTDSFESKLNKARILPVITPYSPENTVELAKALAKGGIPAVEITLRTNIAMESLAAVKEAGLDILIGAGTLTNSQQVEEVSELGVDFAVSPGVTERVLQTAKETGLQLLPGVSGPSDIMLAMEYGLEIFKLFPAGVLNGEKMLKALFGPFPDFKFCPTGGVNPSNLLDYFNLPNVVCVGGTWMVSENLVKNENWDEITRLSSEAVSILTSSETGSSE